MGINLIEIIVIIEMKMIIVIKLHPDIDRNHVNIVVSLTKNFHFLFVFNNLNNLFLFFFLLLCALFYTFILLGPKGKKHLFALVFFFACMYVEGEDRKRER